MWTLLLLILVSFAGLQQTHESILQNKENNRLHIRSLRIDSHYNRHSRDVSDAWNKIKSKIVDAWSALKKITNKAKLRLEVYMQNITDKVEIITKAFDNRINVLIDDFRKLIKKVASAEESLKICLKDDKDIIEKMLKEIIENVMICISNNKKDLATLGNAHITPEDSTFLDSVQNKITKRLETCEGSTDICLHNVKEEIIDELDNATWNVSNEAFEVRNTADNILDLIVTCATEGVTKASSSIFNETVRIIQCIKNKP